MPRPRSLVPHQPGSQQVKAYDHPYKAHEAQKLFHYDPHRFRVLSCGRRWGKSTCGIMELYLDLQRCKEPHPIGWIVAPTYPLSLVDWDTALEMFGPLILQQNAQDHWFEVVISNQTYGLNRTAKIEFKTAEREDKGLRGRGLSSLLVDEASLVGKKAWELGLRPALADKRGKATFISTPRGTGGLFYELFNLGQGNDPEWKSWRFPSNTNPYFPQDEWEKLEKITPVSTWRQEYLAEFVEGEGSVFHGLSNLEEMEPQEYDPTVRWVLGADLAKSVDFTVVYPINDYGEPGQVMRFKDIEWPVQEDAIHRKSTQYGNAVTVVDSSGIGDPIEANLRRKGVPVKGIKTGSTVRKEDLIQGLKIAIEQRWIKLPPKRSHAWLWEELEAYQQTLTDHGNVSYHAPEGMHDDCFVKGTKILTENGNVPIENVRVGDRVLTRDGYHAVVATRSKIKNVISHLGLVGTPNHPVITTLGDKPLQEVNDRDTLYIWNERQSCIEEKSITGILRQKGGNTVSISGVMTSGKHLLSLYIDKYGSIISEKYQKACSFITRMATRLTMRLRTYLLFLQENIHEYICLIQNGWNSCEMLQGGIQVKVSSVLRNGERRNQEKSFSEKMSPVVFVSKNLNQLFAKSAEFHLLSYGNAEESSAENYAIDVFTGSKRRVYNLQVEGKPEYFANNILVHNCVIALALAVHGIGPRLGRSTRNAETPKEDSKYTTWKDYWEQANPKKRKPNPFVPRMGRMERALRFKLVG